MEPSLQLVCLGDNLLLYSPGWPRTQSPPASAGMTGLCCHAWLSSLLFRVTVLDMPESVCLTGARRAQHLALGGSWYQMVAPGCEGEFQDLLGFAGWAYIHPLGSGCVNGDCSQL